jgi:hypothetical protein
VYKKLSVAMDMFLQVVGAVYTIHCCNTVHGNLQAEKIGITRIQKVCVAPDEWHYPHLKVGGITYGIFDWDC